MCACVLQICRSDADVARALKAWAGYGTESQAPIDVFSSGQPRKHTLTSMWGQRASKAAKHTSQPLCGTQPRTVPGGGTAPQLTAERAECPSTKKQNTSQQPIETHARQVTPCSHAVTSTADAADSGSRPNSKSDPQQMIRSTHDSSQAAASVPRAVDEKHAEPAKNAFAVLLGSAKSAAAGPGPARQKPQPPPPQQHGGGGAMDWQDALYNVAMQPER